MKTAPISTRRSRSGFTLVELVAVLSIAAILTSLAVPSYREMVAAQRVRAAASALYGSLVYARSEAIKRNWPVSLNAANAADLASGWAVVLGSSATNCTAPANPTQLQSQEGFSGLAFTPSLPLSAPAFCYNAFGRPQNGGNTTVKISGDGTSKHRCVVVDISGRPSVNEGGC